MYNEYGMSIEARLRLAELRREAAAGRLASACPKRERRGALLRPALSASPVARPRWRARLAWLFGS